ncbi:AI-2E family transporter [Rubrivirga sp. IMCC45206]|uniref:AI-2E family transporter n=1 Tax=Rubrivirga sp. IMCC45206 TaxID=3391614 RepID=UPI00398FE1D2
MTLRSLENRAFLALLVLVTLAFAWTLGGFLLPVFWAVVLAVLFAPLFRWYERRLKGRSTIAALLTLLTVMSAVVAPLIVLGILVTQEAIGVVERVSSGEIDLTEPVAAAERMLPRLSQRAEELGIDFDNLRDRVTTSAVALSQEVASRLLSVGQQALTFTLLLAVTLYVLFFFVRDSAALEATMIRALPLGDPRERRLFSKFTAVTRATVKGTFVIAAVQGTIGGVAFALLGLGSPVLWGVLMGVFSLLPAIGGALVWIPAAVYLVATGAWVKALILAGVGAGIMGTVDNALRPILVGRDAGMPDYMILLSTLGGLATFGFSGLVIGPVVAGLFLTVWEIFTEEFGPADDAPDDTPASGLDPIEAAALEEAPADPPLAESNPELEI